MKKQNLTNFQRKFYSLLRPEIKYLAMDSDGSVWGYTHKPVRRLYDKSEGISGGGDWYDGSSAGVSNWDLDSGVASAYLDVACRNEIFPFKWEDEPLYIADYDLSIQKDVDYNLTDLYNDRDSIGKDISTEYKKGLYNGIETAIANLEGRKPLLIEELIETNKMNNLYETKELMTSSDYKARFKAEYWQTKIRYEKLKTFNTKIEVAKITGKEEPKHDCPDYLLAEQQKIMGQYLHILEVRAVIENVTLQDETAKGETCNDKQ